MIATMPQLNEGIIQTVKTGASNVPSSQSKADRSVGESMLRQSTSRGSGPSCRALQLSAPPIQALHDIVALAQEMHDCMVCNRLVEDRRWHVKNYKNCFLHQDGLRWLINKVLKLEEQQQQSSSVCSSFDGMERYLDEVKVNAAKLGNLMIKAGYISHVCNDHQFDANCMSKTLFFKFHLMTLSVEEEPPPCITMQGRIRRRSFEASVRSAPSALWILQGGVTDDTNEAKNTSIAAETNRKHSTVEFNMTEPSDDVSVITMMTRVSVASSGGSTKDLVYDLDPDQEVDVALFSLAIDFRSNFLLMKKIKDRTYHLKKYKNCFLHDEAMEWLSRQVRFHYHAARQSAMAREEESEVLLTDEKFKEVAANIGNAMIAYGYVSHVCGNHLFRSSMHTKLFFKFHTKRMDRDYKHSNNGGYSEDEVAALQESVFLQACIS
jgi:hypothetical protein